jgi:hypothetical protein
MANSFLDVLHPWDAECAPPAVPKLGAVFIGGSGSVAFLGRRRFFFRRFGGFFRSGSDGGGYKSL